MNTHVISTQYEFLAGTNPGEGHRSEILTTFLLISGKPKMMYWHENTKITLLFELKVTLVTS